MTTINTALIVMHTPREQGTVTSKEKPTLNRLSGMGGNLIFELVEEFWQAGIRNFVFASESADSERSTHWEEDRSLMSQYKHQLIAKLTAQYNSEIKIIWKNVSCEKSLGQVLLDCQGLVCEPHFVLGLASHILIPENHNCLREMIAISHRDKSDVVGLNVEWFNYQQQINDTGLEFVPASIGSRYRSHSIAFSKLKSCKCWNFGRFIFSSEIFDKVLGCEGTVKTVDELVSLNEGDDKTAYYCGPSLFFNCETLDGFLEGERYFEQLRLGFEAKA